mgnify:CR=1 FL=1
MKKLLRELSLADFLNLVSVSKHWGMFAEDQTYWDEVLRGCGESVVLDRDEGESVKGYNLRKYLVWNEQVDREKRKLENFERRMKDDRARRKKEDRSIFVIVFFYF